MSRPTNDSLRRDYIRDLIVDVRCAERDGLPDYADKCRRELAALVPQRHSAKIGRWGVPVAAKAQGNEVKP